MMGLGFTVFPQPVHATRASQAETRATPVRRQDLPAQDLIARLQELDTKIQAAITAANATNDSDVVQAGKDAADAEKFKHALIDDFFGAPVQRKFEVEFNYIYDQM